MRAAARMASVVSATSCVRRRLIRDVRRHSRPMPSTSMHTGLCYTVAEPRPTEIFFLRDGYQIERGDRAWCVDFFPSLPDGNVALEASTADWGIIWIAHFPIEHLVPSPEPVDYVSGCAQNPRPIRPDALTISPRND